MSKPQIRITIQDIETGEREEVEIADDYVLICAGRCYQDGIQVYPTKGTHVITVRNAGGGKKE
jgi:hypothetical protein